MTTPEASSEKSAEPEAHVHRGTNDEVIITLDPATQKLMGLETTALNAAQLGPEVEGYGHVLDITPLAGLVADLTTAEAAREASEAELARLKTLAAQNNASQRALQTGEADATRNQAQTEAARLRLQAAWGSVLAQRQDLPGLVQRLGSLSNLLVEVDVPADETISGTPVGLRVVPFPDSAAVTDAELLGPAPSVDPQFQGRGFLCLITNNTPGLAPGAALTGFLRLPGAGRSGVLVPRGALMRYNGADWVYRLQSDQNFALVPVHLEAPLAGGWFVSGALQPGDKLVTRGAGLLLSEELKSDIEKP